MDTIHALLFVVTRLYFKIVPPHAWEYTNGIERRTCKVCNCREDYDPIPGVGGSYTRICDGHPRAHELKPWR